MQNNETKILLGRKIKHLRNNLKLSQFALGEKIDINQQQVTLIELGKCFPSLKTLEKLAVVFDCEVHELFSFEEFSDEKILREKINKKIKNLSNRLLYNNPFFEKYTKMQLEKLRNIIDDIKANIYEGEEMQ